MGLTGMSNLMMNPDLVELTLKFFITCPLKDRLIYYSSC